MRLAIADPPYPPQYAERYDRRNGEPRVTMRSRARRYYGDGPRCDATEKPADFHPAAGEWDDPARHRALLEQLMDEYDGWAIATTMDGLDHYRPLPVPARTLVWHRPNALPTPNQRISISLEAVVVLPPKDRRGRADFTVPDLLVAPIERMAFAGAKPARWTRWVLDAMGYDQHTDTVDDLFPGSGAVAAAVAQGVLDLREAVS